MSFGSYQQDQGTCGSAHLFGSAYKKWTCYYDFAQEFATLLQICDPTIECVWWHAIIDERRCQLKHLNVKHMYALQSYVSDLNVHKVL